jgi:tetratricopeptide (TPR) repeat protein
MYMNNKWIYSILLCFCLYASHAQSWAELNKTGQEQLKKGASKEATQTFEKALSAAETQFGNKHDNYQATLASLGDAYNGIQAHDKARNCYLQIIQIKKDLRKDNTVEYADMLNAVARSYMASKDLFQGEVYFNECLNARKKIQKETHPDYIRTKHELADMYKSAGKYDKAEIEYAAILVPAKDILGAKSEDYVELLADVADVSFGRRKYEKAIEQYEQFFTTAKASGKKIEGMANYYDNIADAYRITKNNDKAVFYYQESLKAIETQNDMPKLVEALNKNIKLFGEMNKQTDLEALLLKKGELIKKGKGEKSNEYLQNALDLGDVYISLKKNDAAEGQYQSALNSMKAMGKEKEPLYADILDKIANLSLISGDKKEAETLFLTAMEQRKISLTEKNPDYSKKLDSLAYFYQKENELNKADSIFKVALELRKKAPGIRHPDYASSLNNIGKLLIKKDKFAEGETMIKQASQIYFTYYGKSPEYTSHQVQMAEMYHEAKNYNEAMKIYLKVLELRKNLGENHADYQAVLQKVNTLKEEMGRK